MFGDKCDIATECSFPNSTCDAKTKRCQCAEELPVTNHYNKCGKGKSNISNICRPLINHT